MPDIFNPSETPTDVRAEDLVGENKKFKDVDALARGKAEADAFIEQLKAEKAEALKQAAEAANANSQLEQLREEILELKKVQPGSQPAAPDVPPKDIDALVEASMTRAEARKTQAQNIQEANRVMVEHFGDPTKAGTEVANRARELGLTMDDLKGIAARSPSAFKRLVVGDGPAPSPDASLTKPTVVLNGKQDTGIKPGTKEFYQKLLRENPRQYANPATQAEILKHTIAGTYIP